MNKKIIETQKIKVNSITEMLVEMRKLKNSGGEWKVLEKHSAWTPGDCMTDYSKRGFIISNGTKKVDIVIKVDSPDPDLTTFLDTEESKELRRIFDTPFFHRKSKLGQSYTVKNYGKSKEIKRTHKFLSAWSFKDLQKILVDYYVANKVEIDQFSENNFSHGIDDFPTVSAQWLEVGEDDQLFYIWVGKRDSKKGFYLGGGEWEICLRKSDLVGKYSKSLGKLKDFAGPEGAKDLKACLNTHWAVLTDAGDSNRGNKSLIGDYENYQVGFDPDGCNKNDSPVFFPRKNNDETKDSNNQEPDSSKKPGQSQLSAKEQIIAYMEKNGIFRLTLDNDKLMVEYNKTSKKEEKEVNSTDLKTIQDYLKKHNNSVNYEQLKSNSPTTTSQEKKPDCTFWIVGGIGVLVVGILVYWIVRKRKVK